ncbi:MULTISPECIES: OmpA family protein [unclassified Flavobacterium]|uniref:OmpA family protein n=1 Tax=unclassified Flavobacterium TaxID=196869 RepID=UPI003F93D009
MKKNILFWITIMSIFSCPIYSQKAKLANADKNYENYAYIDAIKTYERLADKGYRSADMFEKLANAYYFNAKLEDAAKWYGELFTMDSEIKPEIYYRYAQSLRAIKENDKANAIMEKFNQLNSEDSRGQLFIKNEDYLQDIRNNAGRYKVEDAGINSEYSDYGSSFYLHKLVFTTARDTGSLEQRKHSWTGQYFTNLYEAELDDSLSAGNPSKFDKNVSSRFHESTPAFTKDGKTMYFTRNNYLDGKKGKDSEQTTLLKIYKATYVDDKWSDISELNIDSDNYSVAHPALSPDEKTLYFVSDMPGTFGKSDIFKAAINADGTLGRPINLGKSINTEGRETFPYITDQNELYFASDGHLGIGGLDVFVSKINSEHQFEKVENLGDDINSPKDDFAFIIDTKSKKGFFSSNRDGGQGSDDIYKFKDTKQICEQSLSGKITDLETKEILVGAKISLYDKLFNLIATTLSNEEGIYTFDIECSETYRVRAEKEDYSTVEKKISIASKSGKTDLPIELEKEICKVVVGDDLGKCFGIKMIYFDFDKSDIRMEAALDLEKILDVLIEYPKMKLDIRSHTDSRGTSKYNEKLSDRRAKSTISWLIKNGVDKDRLIGKGYGEYQLINRCSDGVECTEEEHQMNRRSEFIITDL